MSNTLSTGQKVVLTAATVPMIVAGALGGWGTYTNISSEFHRAATALGVVSAGEGVTLVLALVMVGLTMLGQPAPLPVRSGLWLAPVAAAATGVAVADNLTEAVVYAITPMAMSASAEGLGLLARRVVIHQTGIDSEAQRRNAATMQQLAFHRARAANHPDEEARKDSEVKSWKLAKHVGVGDTQLGAHLVDVQRQRLGDGADAALAGMLTVARPPATPVEDQPANGILRERFAKMDPVDAVRIAHDAQPDMPPAELASLLVTYGLAVDAVQVALILGHWPAWVTVERADTADAPLVSELEPVTVEAAVIEAASTLGEGANARQIAAHLVEQRRLVVGEPYIRTALSRATKKQSDVDNGGPMRGGYA